jgi:hypothetical protein
MIIALSSDDAAEGSTSQLRIETDGRGAASPTIKGAPTMRSLKLNAEDRRVYETWLRNIIVLWASVVATMAIVFTVLALDRTVTPEQRAQIIQQSGFYP